MPDDQGFTADERAIMKATAAERREQAKIAKSAKKRELNLNAVLEAIAAMGDDDRALAEQFHRLVTQAAPELDPKTWYGMPAYAKDDAVVCFFQAAGKFKVRYATIGFQHDAALDDGDLWATSFAVTAFTDEVESRLRALVIRAVGR